MKKKNKNLFVDFFLCATSLVFVIPYIAGIYSAIAGIPSGFYHEGSMIYGMGAFVDQFFWVFFGLCLIGVIPISVILNLLFFIVNKKDKKITKFEKKVLIVNTAIFTVGVGIMIVIYAFNL